MPIVHGQPYNPESPTDEISNVAIKLIADFLDLLLFFVVLGL